VDLTREALYKIYYAVPANLRTYAKWRMSEATYKALVEAYAPKDPDDEEDPGPPPPEWVPPGMLFGKEIVIDERYQHPVLVEATKGPRVVVALSLRDAEQIESALLSRGDQENGDSEWRELASRIVALAEGMRAGAEG
jgi:hypothetical protein